MKGKVLLICHEDLKERGRGGVANWGDSVQIIYRTAVCLWAKSVGWGRKDQGWG